jgi:hypothetical protein
MIKLRNALMAVLFSGIFFVGCNKDSLVDTTVPVTDELKKEELAQEKTTTTHDAEEEVDITQLPTVVEVNGVKTLQFANYDHFNYILKTISGMNGAELDKWEETLGFTSMRNEFDQAENRYDEITTERALDEFKRNYADKVHFLEEGDIEIPIGMYHVGSLVNNEGIVKLGEMIQVFNREKVITIVDGDYSKVSYAELLDETDQEENIYISPLKSQAVRTNGVDELSCTDEWNDDNHRIKFKAEIDWWQTPNGTVVTSSQWVPNSDGDWIQITTQTFIPDGTFNIGANLEIEAKSQKKGIFGIPFGHKTEIDVSKGTNVVRTMNGNTTNFWMPLSENEPDAKKLVRTIEVHPTLQSVPGVNSLEYCFGASALLGELPLVDSDCRLWN